MAMIETWLKCDLKKMVQVQQLPGVVFSADNQANLIGVEIMDGGNPATVTGSVYGYAIREDGYTVTITGTLSGNKASIILPASCYAVVGRLSVVIKVSNTTVGAVVSNVYRTTTDAVVDPGHIIPSISELLYQIATMQQLNQTVTAAEQGRVSAESGRVTAENGRVTAENGRVSAESSRVSAESTRVSEFNTEKAAAQAATTAANKAAGKIENMTVAATGSAAGTSPSVTVSDVSGHKHIAFVIPKGDKGDTGKAWQVKRTFLSIAAMQAYDPTQDPDPIELYDAVIIDTGSVEDQDTGKMYQYRPDDQTTTWHYMGDFSGIKGETGNGIASVTLNNDYTLTITYTDGNSITTSSIRGATGQTPNITVGTVTTLQPSQSATVSLDQSSTPEAPVFNFGIPQGETGQVENVYGSTIPMSSTDSTKLKAAIDGKADKDTNAVTGNFAAFDANGNPVDSGHKHGDYLTQHQDISGKADKVQNATANHFAGLDANGNLKDSGKAASDFALSTELASVENGLAYRETGTTASRNISNGEYVFWNGAMYKANGNIASGTTLVSGTNLTPTENVLSAINSKLTFYIKHVLLNDVSPDSDGDIEIPTSVLSRDDGILIAAVCTTINTIAHPFPNSGTKYALFITDFKGDKKTSGTYSFRLYYV